MANKKQTPSPQEQIENFEGLPLEAQIQIFKAIKLVLEEKQKNAQDDLQKLSQVTYK